MPMHHNHIRNKTIQIFLYVTKTEVMQSLHVTNSVNMTVCRAVERVERFHVLCVYCSFVFRYVSL